MKRNIIRCTLLFAMISLPLSSQSVTPLNPEQCTSAVLLPYQSSTRSAVLWKNRDTSQLSNRVVFVDEKPYSYLGLCNRNSPSGRSVFAGLNSEGFAIINTVAYNLPLEGGEMRDLEGFIMADALRSCRFVEDFEKYLTDNLGPDLGSQANFAVLDSHGRAMIFEVHNHGFSKVDPAQEGEHGMINTNFARSGKENEGAGYLRFDRAKSLFESLPSGPVDLTTLLTRITRDTGNPLVKQPTPFDPPDTKNDFWVNTRDSINKYDTSAAIVIVGRIPDDPQSVATMWIIPGEPVCAPALPLWVEARSCPDEFHQGDEAPLWKASSKLKAYIRPYREGNKGHYLNITRLTDPRKGGYFQDLLSLEASILKETHLFLNRKQTDRNFRAFQKMLAGKALNIMTGWAERVK